MNLKKTSKNMEYDDLSYEEQKELFEDIIADEQISIEKEEYENY